ncbi:biotin operon repressor [Enterococcus sp. PF1-24]|uniref:hypothetical protein n=1 Tax=unclassified Enterococcus TaxID=2608891 RepID=UPI0024755D5C|nr:MULTISPECIES: hypothetical protein [unclassified Enterococcus]MDH6364697.1 biotin operon repressor [Enterococcus sp. PFB1-1]MDH6401827.1 biotin operon repressor [Enterococcus sp. PF1-24]
MIELTIIEQSVLELLPKGIERKTKTSEISKLVDLSQREVFAVIQSLRSKGIPVLASRGVNSGLYIAISQDELSNGLRAFKSQQQSMSETIGYLENADVEHWHEHIA